MAQQKTSKRGRRPLPPDQKKKEVKVWVKPCNVKKVKDYAFEIEQKQETEIKQKGTK